MKFLLIVYALFASYKWYTNYMAFVSIADYLENIGDDGPSKEEIEKSIQEEISRIFMKKRN